METITIRAEIDSLGMLHIERPTGLAPGPADVVLVVHSTKERPTRPVTSLSGKYATSSPIGVDPIEEIREIRRRATQEAPGDPRMRYVLDTHALYWHLFEPAKLSPAARQAIAEGKAGEAALIVLSIVIASNRLNAILITRDQKIQASPQLTWRW